VMMRRYAVTHGGGFSRPVQVPKAFSVAR
jgi:hypothetical protein